VVGEGDEIGNRSKETGNEPKEQEATKDNETEGVSKENVTGHGLVCSNECYIVSEIVVSTHLYGCVWLLTFRPQV